MTSTRTVLPVPAGSTTVPRTTWSAWRGSTPRRTATSTVSSNLANADALHELERLPRLVRGARSRFFAAAHVLLAVGRHQSATSSPIDRAVPAIIAMADSIDVAC